MSFTSTPELLEDFKRKCSNILESASNMSADEANEAAQNIANLIKKDWGGQQLYFPKCAEDQLTARDRELWSRFDGTNHSQLAHDFDVSVPWVYKIVKFMRASEITAKQIDAFPDEDLQGNNTRRQA